MTSSVIADPQEVEKRGEHGGREEVGTQSQELVETDPTLAGPGMESWKHGRMESWWYGMRTGHIPRGISTRGPELQTQIMRIIFVNISQLEGEDED